MTTRLTRLASITSAQTPTANAGLWLSKFFSEPRIKESDLKRELVDSVARKAGNSELQVLYRAFFRRWREALEEYGAVTREAKVLGRMVVGLGAESVLENSIALHHTYGIPYIPGSALKGLARHFAARDVDGWSAEHSLVAFGNDKSEKEAFAGHITFFDALYVPPQNQGEKFLHPDVMTVHHQDYYMKGNVPPADWDDPTPIPFLSATGNYLIALAGPADWIEPAFKLLGLALKEGGVGAKTSSGYGRMTLS